MLLNCFRHAPCSASEGEAWVQVGRTSDISVYFYVVFAKKVSKVCGAAVFFTEALVVGLPFAVLP